MSHGNLWQNEDTHSSTMYLTRIIRISLSLSPFLPPRPCVTFTLACFVKSECTPNAKNSADAECYSPEIFISILIANETLLRDRCRRNLPEYLIDRIGKRWGRDAWNARCARPLKQMEFLRVRRPSGVMIAPTATRSSHDGCILKFLYDAVNGRGRRACVIMRVDTLGRSISR